MDLWRCFQAVLRWSWQHFLAAVSDLFEAVLAPLFNWFLVSYGWDCAGGFWLFCCVFWGDFGYLTAGIMGV
ncbi:hypothetical protein A4A49_21559 [Nicotiana attenuata]|uniref:Uncharacterized protein n=2 Tax=Nicotiana attenuata TaxID=49451 RepID=A0A314LIB5_NICAT|nr:hypothetical protein A4A49_21559 [Nicotiana attenuata]